MANGVLKRYNGASWDELYLTPKSHDHAISEVIGLQSTLNAKLGDAPSDGNQYARKNAAWTLVESGVSDWADITGKPTEFNPSSHTHPYASDTHNHDTEYKDINYVPAWAEIAGKPSVFPAEAHNHNADYAAIIHNHDADYKDIAYVPSWGEITGKPSTYTPSTHNHDASYKNISYVPSWGEITGKPTEFNPSTHNHDSLYPTKADTNLGKTGTVSLVTYSTAADYANSPVGKMVMLHSASTGRPSWFSSYMYLIRGASRDSSGGYSVIGIDYTTGEIVGGKASTSADFPTWYRMSSYHTHPYLADTTTVETLGGKTAAQITAEITAAVNALIDGAPGAIDTLNELAAALGDDPNFATTVTNSIATKLSHTNGNNSVAVNSTYFRITHATNGYVEFGAGNTSWAHAHTDRPGFYFNKKVIADGDIGPYDFQSTMLRNSDGHIIELGQRVYSPNNMPTPGAIGASAAGHTHSDYLKYNPDGDGIVISYSDANPTIDGEATGGGHWFGADGSISNGFLAAKVIIGQVVHGDNGFYVGAMDPATGGTGVKVADVAGKLFYEGGDTDNRYALAHSHPYAPTSHAHVIADVTGLQTALDGKAASSHGTHVGSGDTPGTAIELSSSQNLNDLQTAGFYYQTANADTPGNNYPEDKAGSLLVQKNAGQVTQMYTIYNTGKVWVRTYYQSWSAWVDLTLNTDTNTWRPIDDTPVDGVTDQSISSNWAYDHVNASDPHGTAYTLPAATASVLGGVKISLSGDVLTINT